MTYSARPYPPLKNELASAGDRGVDVHVVVETKAGAARLLTGPELTGSMRVWLRPDCGRWLALTIGQGDKELPFEFLIAVGETDAVDPTRSLQDRLAASDARRSAVQGLAAGPLSFTARRLPKAVEAFGQGEQVR